MKTFPKPLSHGEEKLYLKRCKEGDQTARNMLIEHNMRLVAHVVKKYQCQEYDTEDLLSVGTIGLIKAVNTFDTDKGSRLATYAARCVENEILMLLRAGKKRAREVSLFEPIGTDKDGEAVNLVDVIEMENPRTIDQLILDQDIRELYEAFDTCLTESEKQVITMRYGLFKEKEHTQREVAGVLGISRSYVSRIEKKAIGKMRDVFEKHQVL
ncbi:MAG: RNA polymerase sporulation sigma factor SigK [Enterocloster sp.]|nr:RNA polymerase sporulation sigma factor SigK [Enterocloster sp.]